MIFLMLRALKAGVKISFSLALSALALPPTGDGCTSLID